jgi:Lrp/AsnC family transcriptional regulator for asnA, asnC and gidA
MDKIDHKIINLLRKDARLPGTEIARAIGAITPQRIRYRINRLVEQGIIRYIAIIEPRALGLSVTGDVFVEANPDCVANVALQLADNDQVSYVGYSIKSRYISFAIHTRSNEELFEFVTDVVGVLPGVIRTNIIVIPYMIKQSPDWIIPGTSDYYVLGNSYASRSMRITQVEIDDVDQSIMRILQENARFSGEDIAHILDHISGRVIRYRIDRLLEKGVLRPSIIILPGSVGYPAYGELFIQVKPGKITAVGEKIAKLEEIGYVGCSTGDCNLSIEVYGRTENQVEALVTNVIQKMPEVMSVGKIIFIEEVLKVHGWKIPKSLYLGSNSKLVS